MYGLDLRYTILARSNTFQAEIADFDIDYETLIVSDFQTFFTKTDDVTYDVDRIINTSIPEFNESILTWATIHRCHYMDLASELSMDDVVAGHVPQYKFDTQYRRLGLMGIVNAWVSPGLTELMIGRLCRTHDLQPQSVMIYLDEDFNCTKPLFSRSPRVAIQELLTPAVWIQQWNIVHGGVFEDTEVCSIWHKCKDYIRITQEELVSLRSAYPNLNQLAVFAWWSEIEHVRFLYNLWILSDMQMLDLLMQKIPRAATRQEITSAYQKSLIDDAGFEATIVIQTQTQTYRIQIVFDFNSFQQIQHTPYAGSTSIAYPTGLSASWLWYLGHLASQQHHAGVYDCLQLGQMTDQLIIDQVIQHIQQSYINIVISE